ncbi:MAG: 6-phospho-beta-galactosidase [Erysipelotrichaceae bacterium]|nr:6-phospho-beta-galactosidase [Erysipelotrichaceae bacterium]
MKLSKDFVFGGATAAYQCEGSCLSHGKGKVAWDDYLSSQGRFSPEPASDFYHMYPVDLKLCQQFSLQAIRISIAWSRIFPDGKGKINQEGVDFYHRLFQECHKNNVEPYVTLHHFDTPDALHRNGDFLNQETIDAYVEYAKFCFAEYKDEVTYWFTFNEVWPIACNQYISGTFPPCIQYDISKAIHSMYNMMLAHSLAVNIYKEHYDGKIGIIHSLETKYPYDENHIQDKIACQKEDVLANQFLLDMTLQGSISDNTYNIIQQLDSTFHYNPREIEIMQQASKKIDYLGINYYQSHFIKDYQGESQIHHNGTGDKGTNVFRLKNIGERAFKANIPTTDWDWMIYPQGLYDMVKRISQQYHFNKGIYVTENGMGYKDDFVDGIIDDEPRIDYIKQHLMAIQKAINEGINMKGYFVWSLMDMFSWSNGYNKRYGLFYVDFNTQKRYPKASAYWYKRVIENKEV